MAQDSSKQVAAVKAFTVICAALACVLSGARRERPRCLPPLKMSDAEFEAEVAEILRGAR